MVHNNLDVDMDYEKEGRASSETSQENPESEDEYEDDHINGRAGTLHHVARSECDTVNSTRSLYEHDIEYTYIHNRRYVSDYWLPNDEEEQNRWQIMHLIHLQFFPDNLTSVSFTEEPTRILDVGCGPGDWVLDMAMAYPNTEVIGTDIAPIQPTKVPQTVFFEIDDAETPGGWTFTTPFDLIHFRSMAGAFASWSNIYAEAYKHLSPGGWIEVLDYDNHSDLIEFFKEEPVTRTWTLKLMSIMERRGFGVGSEHLDVSMLENLGFEEVSASDYNMPMGAWGDVDDKGTAALFFKLQIDAIESLCLRPFVEYDGMKVEDVLKNVEEVQEAAKRVAGRRATAEGCHFRMRALKGRKPLVEKEGKKENGFIGGAGGRNGV